MFREEYTSQELTRKPRKSRVSHKPVNLVNTATMKTSKKNYRVTKQPQSKLVRIGYQYKKISIPVDTKQIQVVKL